VFSEDDEEVQEARAAEGREEQDSELRPFHSSAGGHGGDGEEEGGEGEAEDAALGGAASWNLRKCSAAGLDMLSNVFGDELLPVLLPIVEARLQEPGWPARESAILALGEPQLLPPQLAAAAACCCCLLLHVVCCSQDMRCR
jgi:transportin-1